MQRIITHMEMERVSQRLKMELIIMRIVIYLGDIRTPCQMLVILVLMSGIKEAG